MSYFSRFANMRRIHFVYNTPMQFLFGRKTTPPVQKEIHGIPYTLRTTRLTRKIIISITPDGSVRVSRSPRISIRDVEKAMEEKYDWIMVKIKDQVLRPKKLLSHYSAKDFTENKGKARALVIERLAYFNVFYKHRIGKIYIRNQKSRWGSCSGRGNLNFNYKIVFLPKELQDYLIVHELCHIQQMNHSETFWKLVSQTVPEWKSLRAQLQEY